jgi:hypothetical protein
MRMTPPSFDQNVRLPVPRRTVKLLAACLAVILFAGCGATPEDLVEDYLSADPEVSGRAERELLALGDEAVPVLAEAFATGGERRKIGRLLARFGEPAVGALIPLVESEDPYLSADAAAVLGETGSEAVGLLIEALETGSVRPADLAATLGRIGGPAWEPMLALLDSTTDENLRGILAATFFTSGDAGLARRLLPRIEDPELGDAFLSAVVAHTPPEELVGGLDAEILWRILTFIPLEPLVGQVSDLVLLLPTETVRELEAMSSSGKGGAPFERDLVRMHLSGAAGEWGEAASYGAGPFETLVVSYDAERSNPDSSGLLRVALLHHGGLYLNYLVEGAEASLSGKPAQAERLSLLAGEVARVIEELMGEAG